MTKTLRVSEPMIICGKLTVLVNDPDNILKNGAKFVDEYGHHYAVENVCTPTYSNGAVDVVLTGPKEIGETLTLL